ncbi:hypothetical protein ACHWQZ_G016869 [Mnemiopsis leidyi]
MYQNGNTVETSDFRVQAADMTIGVSQFLFGLTSTILNIMVIVGFIRLGLKGKVANVLYCALSVSDTLTGISSLVYSILILDDANLELLTGDESFFNVFKLKEGFRICVWLGPLFAFSMMMTISLINVITVCRTFAVVAPFYYKLYLRTSVVLMVVFILATHALFIGIIPLINDVHVYFLDAHSGICAIIPLPGLDHMLKHLQIFLVTMPITLHCVMVFIGTFVLLYFLDQRRKKVVVNEKSGLLSLCYKGLTSTSIFSRSLDREDSISAAKSKLQQKNSQTHSQGSAGQSNADQVDKATVRAERTVLGLLSSFTITYSFWLVGFYMQVHATNKVELPAAWFGITPHVSYYMFRNLEQQDKNSETYFLFTAYGPLCLVILVILNSMVNPIIHFVFNKDLRESAFFCLKKNKSSPPNSHASQLDKRISGDKRSLGKTLSSNMKKTSDNGATISNPLASATVCVEMQNMSHSSSRDHVPADISDEMMMEYAEKEFQFLSEECQPNHPAEEIHAGPWVTTAGHQDNGMFDESSTLASADVISLDTDELDKVGENKYVTAEENETRHSHLGDPGTVVYHNEAATETGVYHNEAATDTDFESDSHQYESYPEPGPGLAHCPAV